MIRDILQKYWGYAQFRPMQEEIIQSVLEGKDTLAVMPTGGGKSICFQVPALAKEGICFVITPLIALMKDQVEQLKNRGITAEAIHSGMDRREIDRMLDRALKKEIKFLYLSPERLKTEIVQERAKRMQVSLLTVDEAHCISQWGYDFRPPYLEIAAFRQLIPETPVIALTASATPRAKEDIKEKLAFRENQAEFQKSFSRDNLSYSCFEESNKEDRLLKILNNVKGSAIVYVRNRKKTKEVADFLNRRQVKAEFYHAGLDHQQRNAKQEAWIQNHCRVMVATNAFGMGIDKADVRVVAHLDLPDCLEAYYQEAGRAGRDEKKAYSVILYNANDLLELERRIELSYPDMEFIRNVYQALANHFHIPVNGAELNHYDFDLAQFQHQFNLDTVQTFYALRKLEEEGLIQMNEAFYQPSKVQFIIPYRDLYDFQLKNPKAEALIKFLLRFYGSELHSNYVKISESQIARYLKRDHKEVEEQLKQLQQRKILEYLRQSTQAQVIFLTPRYEAKHLPLDKLKIEERKKNEIQRAKAVATYASHRHRCRTQLLQEYFGEISYHNCGICDNCLERKKQMPVGDEFGEHSRKIIELVKDAPLSLQQLAEKMHPIKEKKVILTVQQMVDAEQLVYLKDGRIALGR